MHVPFCFSLALATASLQTAYAASSLNLSKPSCANIPAPTVPGAKVLSIVAQVKHNYTVQQSPPTLNQDVTNLNICDVTVTLRHNGANDTVTVQTWLPLDGWNGRFTGIGGGAWLAGQGQVDLALPASQGYAVSSTDAGLGKAANPYSPSLWALNADGTTNTDLLTNFASRSIHDLAVVGKAVVAAYYGRPATYAYFNGCSTGGRQGLAAAQQYPADFNGILAGAPAIYWTEYVIAELWPQVVMKEAGYYPSPCEFNAVLTAAIAACDKDDQVQDGVIDDPLHCHFNPFTLVGRKLHCDGSADFIVSKDLASVVEKIWQGPKTSCGSRLWYGLPIGASFSGIAHTKPPTVGTKLVGDPVFVADTWVRYFVERNATFDTSAVNVDVFRQLFNASTSKFGNIIGSANPDLRNFKQSGGKLLVWHGLADQLIFPQDSIHYRDQVKHAFRGGGSSVDDFFRLFLAPGVDHCGYDPSAPGAKPVDPLASLIAWVEEGTAPEFLPAETSAKSPAHFTRKICRYPKKSQYKGHGDPSISDNYYCI